ncbi:MAG: NAD(P)-binding domain-containing protein [Ekhidna sp.]
MKIAIVGTGNVGGVLAGKWAKVGHEINLGVRDPENFKGRHLLEDPAINAYPIEDAVAKSKVIVMATPAPMAVEVTQSLGNTTGKVIIDTMNIVNGKGPEGFETTSEAILANTDTRNVIKCFNSTGFNNMIDPVYDGKAVDMFMCGDSEEGKEIARQLAHDIGFEVCYDVGGNDKFYLMEQFASFWINLAMFQGQGREIAFKLLKR